MSIELELDEREFELIMRGLSAVIEHRSTSQADWRDAAELSDFLRALGAGHFEGWDDEFSEEAVFPEPENTEVPENTTTNRVLKFRLPDDW